MQQNHKETDGGSSQVSDPNVALSITEEGYDEMFVPDGGKDAWLTVTGAWFVLFGSFGYLYAFGVYQDYYTRVYLTNHSPSNIAWIGSFQLMMPFALGVVSGKLFDEGYFHIVQITGGLLFTFSLFMLSLAKPQKYYQIFLSQGVGMGIGLGLIFVPSVGIMVHHFKKRKGLASGVALSGSSIGSIIFPIMLNHLIPSVGFAQAVRATGYLVLGTLVIGNCLMKTRLPPRKKRRVQLPPPDIRSFLKDPPYMFAVLGALIASLGFYFPVIYLQLYSVLHSVDMNLAFYSLAILNGSSAVGRVLGNYLADIYGPFNIQVPCTVAIAALVWAVLGINNSGSLIAVSVLYGIFSGAWLALAFACFSSLSSGPQEVGARTGLGLALSSVGSLVAAPIQGQLLTPDFVWIRPIAFSASVLFASSVCFGATRFLQSRKFSSQRV
ncbi:hypothetical protein E1B28_006325 [Marasmius oreades]|uniref:MFS general substrate transporter n=1 Tax=Marasmius oreades TaxID=181124 RepID=A0A9P7S5C8_9AGAR|nr:uncharacterized protein E1B28_006325 [Marasmius oreades]KAG7095595.1 hypothetical protein E1B28_006325 [Marasmius oreades]